MTAPHRIRRQRWIVRTTGSHDPFALRSALRRAWEETLLQAMERAFDDAARGDAIIHLTRLDVDLHLSSADDLSSELPALIERQLREQLRAALDNAAQPGSAVPPQMSTPAQGAFADLLHYVRTGSLPWPLVAQANDAAAERLRGALLSAQGDELARLAAVVREEGGGAPALFRVLQLLPDEELSEFVHALLAGMGRAADSDVAWIVELVAAIGGDRRTRLERASVLLAGLLVGAPARRGDDGPVAAGAGTGGGDVGDGGTSLRDDMAELLRGLDETATLLRQLEEFAVGTGTPVAIEDLLADVPEERRDEVRRFLETLPASVLAMLGGAGRTMTADTPGDVAGDAAAGDAAAGDPAAGDASAGDDGPVAGAPNGDALGLADMAAEMVEQLWGALESADGVFPIAMPNAGLVLAHSFIVPLLANTGIIVPGATELADAAVPRAAAMLHFLATGRQEAYEFELGFIRVLLGVAADRPLNVGEGMLGDADRAEAEAVLDAMIEHWGALGNTSRDGLRTSFLARSGLLRREQDGWRLQVEPATFDMLLGRLPWGISIVRLPWMSSPMHVEWERP